MTTALYGHGGFFHRPEGPAGHFRTSVHASTRFAAAVVTLLRQVDELLGHPDRLDLVDVGAGRAELLLAVRDLVAGDAGLAGRLRLAAVERADRPDGIPSGAAGISWAADLPEQAVGLLIANEWLDDVPLDVVELGTDGPYRVLVEPSTGVESPGGPVGLRDAAWLGAWWPLDPAAGAEAGDRAEVGRTRDEAWAAAVGSLARGVAVCVDYGHLRADRVTGRYATGTLAGYRDGRAVAPVPDGSCDLTVHVAMDACGDAGERAGATATSLVRQREALRALGVSGAVPPVELARTDPAAYVRRLQTASEEAELLDPAGLGGFWWLVQSVGTPLPRALASR